MQGNVTAVNATAQTITTFVDTISGPTTIAWTPWVITLLSIPSAGLNFNGVLASNNVTLSSGLTVWNVNSPASFAVGQRVQVTWQNHATDYLQGNVTAVDWTLSTITVNADTLSGPTTFFWTPWTFTVLTLPTTTLFVPPSSSSAAAAVASSSASLASSSTGPNYDGVLADNNLPAALGSVTWHVNTLASFAVGDRVKLTWTGDSDDYMIGFITAVDPVASTMTVDADTRNGDTIPWTPWIVTLVTAHTNNGGSSSSAHTNNGGSSSSTAVCIPSYYNTCNDAASSTYHLPTLLLSLLVGIFISTVAIAA